MEQEHENIREMQEERRRKLDEINALMLLIIHQIALAAGINVVVYLSREQLYRQRLLDQNDTVSNRVISTYLQGERERGSLNELFAIMMLPLIRYARETGEPPEIYMLNPLENTRMQEGESVEEGDNPEEREYGWFGINCEYHEDERYPEEYETINLGWRR